MRKKGEMTSSQIIGLVLAVGAFIVLLVFAFFIIDIRTQSEDELCRLSVLTRATSPDLAQRALPLKCTTKKICLNKNNEDCAAFLGEENVLPIKLPADNASAARLIENITANAMYDCWSMMGEGKLNLFGGAQTLPSAGAKFLNFGVDESTCVVCSRVALSPSVLADKELLNMTDVNLYMVTHRPPETSYVNYIDAFSQGELSSYGGKFSGQFSGVNKTAKVKQTDEIGIIFMQIKTPRTPWEAFGDTSQKVGSFLIAGTMTVSPKLLVNPWVAGGEAVLSLGSGGLAAFQTWQSRQVSASYCQEFQEGEEDPFSGCSITTGFDYHDISNLRNFCGRIEGTP